MFQSLARRHNKSGFTLIELSIVLVIIGLIVGGILVGQDLIKSAEMRNLASQLRQYQVATSTFRGKYNEIPGDMLYINVQAFGLGIDGTTVACNILPGQPLPSSIFCNGDGKLDCADVLPTGFYGFQVGDCVNFWEELSAAGLIAGKYNAAQYGNLLIGVNYPAVNYNSAYGILAMFGNDEVDGNAALGGGIWLIPSTQNGLNNGNSYWTTQYLPNSADSSGYPMLTALQAYQLDQKTDDGSPQSGNLRAVKFANDVNSPGGQYMTNDDNNKWALLIFKWVNFRLMSPMYKEIKEWNQYLV